MLQSLDSLGAGFQLASHDLDIRGGGNLLGDEQSGHIREIGVELYQQMLEDAVAELQDQGPGAEASTRPRLVAADQHRRGGADPRRLCAGPQRAPGALPPPVRRRAGRGPRGPGRRTDRPLRPPAAGGRPAAEGGGDQGPVPRGQCRQDRRRAQGRGGQLPRRPLRQPGGPGRASSRRTPIAWRLRPDQKVVVKGEWETPEARLGAAERILGELAKLARG